MRRVCYIIGVRIYRSAMIPARRKKGLQMENRINF